MNAWCCFGVIAKGRDALHVINQKHNVVIWDFKSIRDVTQSCEKIGFLGIWSSNCKYPQSLFFKKTWYWTLVQTFTLKTARITIKIVLMK